MPDFKTSAQVIHRPKLETYISDDALARILAESEKTLEEKQIEFEFLWSLTDKTSTLRPTTEGLTDREVSLRKMLTYVMFLRKKTVDRKLSNDVQDSLETEADLDDDVEIDDTDEESGV